MVRTENQIKDQIAISKTKAVELLKISEEQPEKMNYNNGYIHALEWILGRAKAKYNKEDI